MEGGRSCCAMHTQTRDAWSHIACPRTTIFEGTAATVTPVDVSACSCSSARRSMRRWRSRTVALCMRGHARPPFDAGSPPGRPMTGQEPRSVTALRVACMAPDLSVFSSARSDHWQWAGMRAEQSHRRCFMTSWLSAATPPGSNLRARQRSRDLRGRGARRKGALPAGSVRRLSAANIWTTAVRSAAADVCCTRKKRGRCLQHGQHGLGLLPQPTAGDGRHQAGERTRNCGCQPGGRVQPVAADVPTSQCSAPWPTAPASRGLARNCDHCAHLPAQGLPVCRLGPCFGGCMHGPGDFPSCTSSGIPGPAPPACCPLVPCCHHQVPCYLGCGTRFWRLTGRGCTPMRPGTWVHLPTAACHDPPFGCR